jgi:hypothetical protein
MLYCFRQQPVNLLLWSIYAAHHCWEGRLRHSRHDHYLLDIVRSQSSRLREQQTLLRELKPSWARSHETPPSRLPPIHPQHPPRRHARGVGAKPAANSVTQATSVRSFYPNR